MAPPPAPWSWAPSGRPGTSSEIPLTLPVFHRRLASLVVVARSALGDAEREILADDLVDGVRTGFEGPGAGRIADGPEAHLLLFHALAGQQRNEADVAEHQLA